MRINPMLPTAAEMTPAEEQLWEACQGLEQAFLEILLRQVQSSINTGLTPKSFQREIYEDMQRQALAEQMAKTGEVGLAAMLYRQLNMPTVDAADIDLA
jgi:Rod binding domain-containing protein